MTSGQFSSIPIDNVTILPDRQRKQVAGVEDLARSIQAIGLINPIVVNKDDGVLVAGECRLTACRSLGWTSIPVQWTEDLSEDELHLIELEENVKRTSLTWQDHCAAVTKYHQLNADRDSDWTLGRTAESLGISERQVSSRRSVQAAIEAGDPLVLAADKYSVARGIVERKANRAKESDMESLDDMLGAPQTAPEAVARSPEAEAHTSYMEEENEEDRLATYIRHGEFADFLTTYRGPKFNFIHCDFPYGINAGTHHQGAADKFGGYDDSEDVYWQCIMQLENAMEKHIAQSAHMMFWFSMEHYHHTVRRLTEMGWVVNPFPLVWWRSDNSGIMPDPKRGGRRTYETALHCTRGDRHVSKPVSMLIDNPNTKLVHMSEKPLPVLAHFFRMFVDDTTVMLDPTAGSGNAVAAALLMGAKDAVGVERDADFHAEAVRNVNNILEE
jgi:ParB-like chromosome segregation protein Spo0J